MASLWMSLNSFMTWTYKAWPIYSASTQVQCDAAVTAEYGCSLHSVICHILATRAIGGILCVYRGLQLY